MPTHPSPDVFDNVDEAKLFSAGCFLFGTSQGPSGVQLLSISIPMLQLVGHQDVQGMVSHGGSYPSEVWSVQTGTIGTKGHMPFLWLGYPMLGWSQLQPSSAQAPRRYAILRLESVPSTHDAGVGRGHIPSLEWHWSRSFQAYGGLDTPTPKCQRWAAFPTASEAYGPWGGQADLFASGTPYLTYGWARGSPTWF